MSLLNRSAAYANMYDSEGRLQGGLAGLEELAQVIALNSGNDRPNDTMADEDDDPPPARDFPVRNPTESSSPSTLDSDEDMDSEEPGSSDDEAMEEIVMYDDLSPIPITKALPQVTPVMSSPEETPSQTTEFVDQDPSTENLTSFGSSSGSSLDSDSTGLTSRASSGKGSRRRSRSRRRVEASVESLLPIGEQLKRRLLEENVVGGMIVSLVDPITRQDSDDIFRTCFSTFPGITSCTVPSMILFIKS